MSDETEIYEDQAGEWRWRRKAGNHEVIADSGEGYSSRSGALRASHRVFPPPSTPSRWPLFLAFLVGVIVGALLGFLVGRTSAGETDPGTVTTIPTSIAESESSTVTSPSSLPNPETVEDPPEAFGITSSTIRSNVFTPTPEEEGTDEGMTGAADELVETL